MDRFTLFSEARERLCAAFSESVQRLLASLVIVFERQAERSIDLRVRSEMQEALTALTSQKQQIIEEATDALNELIFRRLELESNAQESTVGGGLLELLPEAELDEQIYSEELAQRIKSHGGEEYVALVMRVHELTRYSAAEDRSPVCAGLFSGALVQALRRRTKDRIVWRLLRSELATEFPADMTLAIADVNDFLRGQGVLPQLPRFIAKVEPSTPQKKLPIEAPRATTATHEPQKPVEISQPVEDQASNQKQKSVDQLPMVERAAGVVTHALSIGMESSQRVIRQRETPLERALEQRNMLPVESLEAEGAAFAAALGLEPYSRDARNRLFSKIRDALPAQQKSSGQGAVVDVVQSLFDYSIDEEQVPVAAKPLMWRLQLPTVILSLLDSAYLGPQNNSLRRLVENFAAIVMAFPDDVYKGSELFIRLETSVRAVEIVAHTLQNRAGVLATMLNQQFDQSLKGLSMIAERLAAQRVALESMPEKRNRRNYGRRPSRDAEIAVTQRISDLLRTRLDGKDVPDSVRAFLGEVWIRRMRTAALRDGENSQTFRSAVQIVDDLLWSVGDRGKRVERRDLAHRIPPMIKELLHGLRSVGVDEKSYSSFFDELFLIHLRRIQKEGTTKTGIALSLVDNSAQAPAVESPVLPEPQLYRLEQLNAQARETYITIPLLGTDEVILDEELAPKVKNQSPTTSPPQEKNLVQSVSLATSEEQSREPQSAELSHDQSSVPIPSLGSLTSKDFLLPKARGFEKTKPSRTSASSVRVSGVKIKGFDQMAAAASIDVPTIPTIPRAGYKDDSAWPAVSAKKKKETSSVLPTSSTTAIKTPTVETTPSVANQVNSSAVLLELSTPERRLIDVLDSVDFSDFKEPVHRRDLSAEEGLEALSIGNWLELLQPGMPSKYAKLAWINDRRTVFLFVRLHDKKAVSLRAADLFQRISEKRAFLLRLS